jgi:hypothetical protein
MRIGFSPARILVATLLLAVVATACGSPGKSGKAESYSTSQILDQTRLAMDDVVTFRMLGIETMSESHGLERITSTDYSEFQSAERFSHEGSLPTGSLFFEGSRVGSQWFRRGSDFAWEEQRPILSANQHVGYGGEPLMNLDLDDLILVSTNDLTDEGIEVFRFQSTEKIEHPDRPNGPESELFTKTVLISKQTFRIVSKTDYKDLSRDAKGSAEPASWQYKYTRNYYDYNEPIVVEVPASYVPWSESVASSANR